MSRTQKYQQPNTKSLTPKKGYKIYLCSYCGVNEVEQSNQMCWECEAALTELDRFN